MGCVPPPAQERGQHVPLPIPRLPFPPSWSSAILPSLPPKKSVLKRDFPAEIVYDWEVIIFQQVVVRKVPFEPNNRGSHCDEPSHSSWWPSFIFGKFCWQNHGGHKCRQLHRSTSDSPERVSQFLMTVAKKKGKMKSNLNSLKYSFGLWIHTVDLAPVTPILANSGTWCSEQLPLFRQDEKIKLTGEKKSSILVYLTHTVIYMSYISFNKLLCNSYRAWYNDWFKITALLKLHCSSSSWVIFMWSVKLSNK